MSDDVLALAPSQLVSAPRVPGGSVETGSGTKELSADEGGAELELADNVVDETDEPEADPERVTYSSVSQL